DTDPTHFSVVALSINPTEADPGSPGAFPTDWTLFTYDYAGGGSGRFAFEYLVSDVAVAGDYIGIDTVSTTAAAASGVAEPASLVLVMAAVVGLAATRRRRESED
ncbi:MAG: choice-of-anchor J domain-containing protein, partial [Burkholderiales bacterium]|nr:choice-of-anchor J domain-containing protein [Burkholderiales bacterium]